MQQAASNFLIGVLSIVVCVLRSIINSAKSLISRILERDVHGLYRGFFVLLAGASFSKFLALLVMPLLTRVYSPEQFGLYALFNASVAVTSPFLTLRYVLAIPLPKRDDTAKLLLWLCIVLIIIGSVTLTVVLLLSKDLLAAHFNVIEFEGYWWIIVCGVLGASLYEVGLQWAIRERAFTLIAKTQVTQGVCAAAVKLIIGYFNPSAFGLLIGGVIERTMGVLSLLRGALSGIRIASVRNFRIRRLNFLLSYYRDMPIWRLPAQFLFGFSVQIPILMVAYVGTPDTVGQLSLTFSILFATINLIGQTTGKAFTGVISNIGRHRPHEIRRLVMATFKRSLWTAAVPALTLLFGGEIIFTTAFGSQWALAGEFAQCLAPLLLAQLLVSPIASVLTVLNKNRYTLRINFVRCALSFPPFILGQYFGASIVVMMGLYSAFIVVHYAIVFYTTVTMLSGMAEEKRSR